MPADVWAMPTPTCIGLVSLLQPCGEVKTPLAKDILVRQQLLWLHRFELSYLLPHQVAFLRTMTWLLAPKAPTVCILLLDDDNSRYEYLHSIDETPKFVESPNYGTTPIEHYIRRLVTYLARVQSVTQSSENGLTLRVYVKLDTKEWLRMYARLRNACELTSCMHLPNPVMLTAAALVKDESDLVTGADVDDEMRTIATRSINSLRAMDFDIVANSAATRTRCGRA